MPGGLPGGGMGGFGIDWRIIQHKGPQDGRKTVTPHRKRPSKTTTTSKFTCVLSLRRGIVFCIGTVPNEKISRSSGRSVECVECAIRVSS